jgi:hypothetical protein
MSAPVNTHAARTMLNRDPDLRDWAEQYLKEQERARFKEENSTADDEEFERHWRYVRPERMHEGAIEAVTAYRESQNK